MKIWEYEAYETWMQWSPFDPSYSINQSGSWDSVKTKDTLLSDSRHDNLKNLGQMKNNGNLGQMKNNGSLGQIKFRSYDELGQIMN